MGMLTRRERDDKARRTDQAAGAIIDGERNASEAKTARLRALRQAALSARAIEAAKQPESKARRRK